MTSEVSHFKEPTSTDSTPCSQSDENAYRRAFGHLRTRGCKTIAISEWLLSNSFDSIFRHRDLIDDKSALQQTF